MEHTETPLRMLVAMLPILYLISVLPCCFSLGKLPAELGFAVSPPSSRGESQRESSFIPC